MNTQSWFPLGLTGLISLLFKGPSRLFSSTTVQKCQFIGILRQEYWSGLPCPPPENLPDPGIEPRSSALQADFCCLNHQESQRILEWVAYSFSRGPSWPRNWTGSIQFLHSRWILYQLSYQGSPYIGTFICKYSFTSSLPICKPYLLFLSYCISYNFQCDVKQK